MQVGDWVSVVSGSHVGKCGRITWISKPGKLAKVKFWEHLGFVQELIQTSRLTLAKAEIARDSAGGGET